MSNLSLIRDDLAVQMEQHKQQIIHCETINMMTKYQLVFLKMETQLNKIGLTARLRSKQQKCYAFQKLKYSGLITSTHYNVVALNMGDILHKLELWMRRKERQNVILGFQKMRFQFPKGKNDKIRKSFQQVIQSKDGEIRSLQIKEAEMIENLNQQRSKEQELQTKLKQKDGQLAQLELDLKRHSGNNKTLDSKQYRHLELENQEMQDRIIGTEDSVNLFIKEMNELLDTHEMSTNLDSDGSYEQVHNIEYQSQRQNPISRQNKPKNFYSNQLTKSTKLN